MTLQELNALSPEKLQEALTQCCGASHWVKQMVAKGPYGTEDQLHYYANYLWENAQEETWLEAFTHHPKIGDIDSLAKKFASTKKWASGEQSGVETASRQVLENLAKGNADYEEKFGYIFIVCATGKSAEEMLMLLKERLPNEPEEEIFIAMAEQQKITKIRLNKLLS